MSYSCFCLHEAFSGYESVSSGCEFAPSVFLCDRLTCPAQPGHGGKRSDSPERGITSAVTELTQAIDHNRNNLIENWLNIHIFCCWVNYEMLSFSRLLTAQPWVWSWGQGKVDTNNYILLIDRLCEAEKERQSYILLSHSVNMNHVEICFIACITYMAIILVWNVRMNLYVGLC